MTLEHPFAQYIRIIGKGPRLSRPLTRSETEDATTMILKGAVNPVQLGAFLCILRVRSEVPEEAAGFIDAVREDLKLPAQRPSINLDWPSYAGKVRQLPYYLLAALALAESGVKIFMHGIKGHTEDRIDTTQTLKVLNIAESTSFEDAASRLEAGNFAYLSLEKISPVLQEIVDLKTSLGVRTPVNTFARMINAFDAPCVLQCITHAAYRDTHRDSAELLGQERMSVFKGEGGEIERRPTKPVSVQYLVKGERFEEDWPALLDQEDGAYDEEMDLSRLISIWKGTDTHPYALAAIEGTIAIALRTMGCADSPAAAYSQAQALWAARNKDRLPYAE